MEEGPTGRPLTAIVGTILVGLGAWGLKEIIAAGGNLAWILKSIPAIAIVVGVGLLISAVQRKFPLGTAVSYVLLVNSSALLAISTYSAVVGIAHLGEILAGFFALLGLVGMVVSLATIFITVKRSDLGSVLSMLADE